MKFDEVHDLVIVVGAIVILKFSELLLTSFYKKVTKNDYVTKTECVTCHDEIAIIRGILIIVAVKIGIPDTEWQKLLISKDGGKS